MDMHKKMLRFLIPLFCGRNMEGTEAIPILSGPLRRKLLPKQPALEQLSMLFGCYEPAVISEILRLSRMRKIAYDVGAHIGYMTLALAHGIKNGGKVFAFEPEPGNVHLISKLVTMNRLEKRVTVIPLALADKKGKQKLAMWRSPSMHLLQSAIDGQDTAFCQTILVEASTIDSFVFDHENPAPDLIKIDVEGAEALVLKGALRTIATWSPNIIIEIHGPKNGARVWEALDSLEYSWMKLTAKGQIPVMTKENLVSYFSKHSWTHHFLLIKV
jgi:FkbM family methyltransferase